jgi:hypothetical protein
VPTKFEVTKAIRASDLPAPARLVMFVLADVAETGTAEIPEQFTPSLRVLGLETGLGESTVKRHLKELEADGWVIRHRPTVEGARYRSERTRYRLSIPGWVDPGPRAGYGRAHSEPGLGPERATSGPTVGPLKEELNQANLDQSEQPSAAPERPDVEQLCAHLADRIEGNGSKRPKITVRWRDAARLLLDKDGRTVEQVMRAVDWCQADDFWRSNILSMPKLREKYDQLRLAAQRGNARASPPASAVRHIDDLTPEQRAARNPFATAVRASEVARGAP